MDDCQGVETPRPLVSAQKGARKTTNYHNKPRDGAAQEQARRKHDRRGQEFKNWRHESSREQQGTSRRPRPSRGGCGSRNCGRRKEPIRAKPQGLTGVLESRQWQRKGDDRMGDKAAETGSWYGAVGADRDLGIRSRAARQQAQRQAVEAGGIGPFSRWTSGPRPEEGG